MQPILSDIMVLWYGEFINGINLKTDVNIMNYLKIDILVDSSSLIWELLHDYRIV